MKLELSSVRRAKTGEYGEGSGDLTEYVVTTDEVVVVGAYLAECKAVIKIWRAGPQTRKCACPKINK